MIMIFLLNIARALNYSKFSGLTQNKIKLQIELNKINMGHAELSL